MKMSEWKYSGRGGKNIAAAGQHEVWLDCAGGFTSERMRHWKNSCVILIAQFIIEHVEEEKKKQEFWLYLHREYKKEEEYVWKK